MNIFNPDLPISFKYPSPDQDDGLFVRASIYDVTSGTPVFNSTVDMVDIEFGYYFGNFTGDSAHAYLIICLCYTDGTYATVDTDHAPESDVYKASNASPVFSGFDYAAFDLDSGLFVAADIVSVETGSAIIVARIHFTYVMGGVYFGSFTGSVGGVCHVIKLVFTDGTYTTPDTDYAPGSASFQLTSFSSLSLSEIADAVWDADLADHTTSGTFGVFVKKLLTVGKFLGLQ